MTIAVSRGDYLTAETVVGQPGVRTHGSLALMLGAAERVRQSPRRAAHDAILAGFTDRGQICGSREVLTPSVGSAIERADRRGCNTATCPAESSTRARDGGGQRLRAHTGGHQRHPRVANLVARSEHANRGTSC